MSHALVVGKFYPPHAGHHYLINKAIRECDKVTVAACYSSVENIDIEDRKAWLQDAHGQNDNFEVITVKDDTPVMYTDETWGYFLDALMEALDWQGEMGYPDTIYSGESYAAEFAERLDRRYSERIFRNYVDSGFPPEGSLRAVIVDRDEIGFKISATAVRYKPEAYWDYLRPATRAGLAKRIVVCGAESTGTTTLAKALAQYYRTTVVPEYGRHFDWAVGKYHKWTDADFMHIAVAQKHWENDLARVSENGLLICDTDEFATAMFSEIYLGHQTPAILDFAEQTPADLYIITDHEGVDFEDDGTRYNSSRRPWMTDWFLEHLPGRIIMATGSHEQRMKHATKHIDALLERGWGIEEPLEYRQ